MSKFLLHKLTNYSIIFYFVKYLHLPQTLPKSRTP